MEIPTNKKVKLKTMVQRHLADIITPVSLYLKVRDHYTEPVLLESNDFSSAEDSFSFLGLEAIGGFQVERGRVRMQLPGQERVEIPVRDIHTVPKAMRDFLQQFGG